jgi:hypothetical protein
MKANAPTIKALFAAEIKPTLRTKFIFPVRFDLADSINLRFVKAIQLVLTAASPV